jgi:preprotein translocase subunit SecE
MNASDKKRKKGWSRKQDYSGPESEMFLNQNAVQTTGEDIKRKSRQEISKSGHEKETKVRNAISGYINIIVQFLRDSKTELKKVKWPTRKELLASTSMVIILALTLALFLGLIDFGLLKIITKIIG